MMQDDQKFVEMIIKTIVANPNDVNIERTVDERGVLLSVNVNQTDIGYVIGKKGQTVNAIRTLAKVVGAKNNARVNLKIVEPEGFEKRREQREESRVESREEVTTDMVDDLKI
ncbi:MAG: KH domain-containing protein [bacterium]